MSMAYIKIFLDCLESIEPLDDAERGRLFTALLAYARTGETPALQGNERFVFPTLRLQLDRESAAYEGKCETNRRNGAAGGNSPRKRTLANASQDKDKDEDKDKEKDKDSSSGASRPGQTSGLRDRAPGRRPAAGPRREKSVSKNNSSQARLLQYQRDQARMEKFLQQLREERAAMEARGDG